MWLVIFGEESERPEILSEVWRESRASQVMEEIGEAHPSLGL